MDQTKLKELFQKACNGAVKLATTFYNWMETKYQNEKRIEQYQLAQSKGLLLVSEFSQFLIAYPMPERYSLETAANVILFECLTPTRYELMVPLKTRAELDSFALKMCFAKYLNHNLALCKSDLHDRYLCGYPVCYQLLPYLEIVNVHQAESGFLRITVELGGS